MPQDFGAPMLLSALVPIANSVHLVVFGLNVAAVVVALVLFLIPVRQALARLDARTDKLEKISYLDPLTGLRSGLMFRAELADLARRGKSIGLLYIDLDDFGRFNECGHRDGGDRALVEAAHAISKALRRKADRLYRLHGDEFVALFPDGTEQVLRETASRMLALVSDVVIDGSRLSATIAGAVSDKADGAALERAADGACNAQKKIEKGTYVLAPPPCIPLCVDQESTARVFPELVRQDQKVRYRLATQIPQSDGVPTPIQVETPERLPSGLSLAGGAP